MAQHTNDSKSRSTCHDPQCTYTVSICIIIACSDQETSSTTQTNVVKNQEPSTILPQVLCSKNINKTKVNPPREEPQKSSTELRSNELYCCFMSRICLVIYCNHIQTEKLCRTAFKMVNNIHKFFQDLRMLASFETYARTAVHRPLAFFNILCT